jgi:amino acid adenylation domain-containing protein
MIESSSRLQTLSTAERAALEQRLLQRFGRAPSVVPARDRSQPCPLTNAQERVWIIEQMHPGLPVYNEAEAVRLRGTLDAAALEHALNCIVERHEALRMSVQVEAGKPVQTFTQQRRLALKQFDLSDAPADVVDQQLNSLLLNECRRLFDLSRDLVIRATLIKLAQDEHVLLIVVHHIACDRLSIGILFRELSQLYRCLLLSAPSPFPELKIQYGDYAAWQKERLLAADLSKERCYWKERLKDVPPSMELPYDRAAPANPSFEGQRLSFCASRELTAGLRQLSKSESLSLFVLCAAVFKLLLYRYTGQDRVLVGVPINKRTAEELQPVIGFFADTHVLLTDLSGNPTFIELLHRVRQALLAVYDNDKLPFELLVRELQAERALGTAPFLQVMLNQRSKKDQMRSMELHGLSVTPVVVHNGCAKFDLTLAITDEDDSLQFEIEYASDLFERFTIDNLVEHYQRLLEAVVLEPHARLSDLPLMSQEQLDQMLVSWNDTRKSYPQKCIQDLFEDQVRETPDRIAVKFAGSELTYKQLSIRANKLANYLQKSGVHKDVLIGVCVERSLNTVISMLAVLKAGGAYLPLDNDYPQDRLIFMIDDAQVPIVLTEVKLAGSLANSKARLICLDAEEAKIEQESEQAPAHDADIDSLAYVTYTSGSTGTPKGVEVIHRGVVRLIFGSYVSLSSEDRILHYSAITFDITTFELWAPLVHGGCCVIYQGHRSDIVRLGETIVSERISTMWLTGSFYDQIVDVQPECLRGVRQLLIGGEALSVAHVSLGLKQLSQTTIVNGYGPTENTTFTCCYSIPADFDPSARSVSIGRPISNTQVYVLDDYMRPVPVGIAGELYAGGDGLARGYRNRPQLTEERFVPDPFSKQPGAKLYRTGDRVRYLSDGTIEFLGRRDGQIKLRGIRIELAEINAVIEQHQGVLAAATVLRDDTPVGKAIVSYVVPRSPNGFTSSELRSYIKKKLPTHMVPGYFVILDALPISPNGKLERRLLPAPSSASAQSDGVADRNRTPTEELVLGAMSDLLALQQIRSNDNFFDLGGHSLMALQLINRLEKLFNSKIAVGVLFQCPTAAELAAHINATKSCAEVDALQAAGHPRSLVAIKPGGTKKPLFFIPGGNGAEEEFLVYAKLARYLDAERPFYGLKNRASIPGAKAHRTVEAMAADYLAEVKELQSHGPYFLAGECRGGVVAYEMARQLEAMGEQVALVALLDCRAPNLAHFLGQRLKWGRTRAIQIWNAFGKSPATSPATSPDLKSALSDRWQEAVPNRERDAIWISYQKTLLSYRPRPYTGKVVLFLSDQCRGMKFEATWKNLVRGGLQTIAVPGDHHTYIRAHAGTIANRISDLLESV